MSRYVYTHTRTATHTRAHARIHAYTQHDGITGFKFNSVRAKLYGVATISRFLKIVGLFCKRALQKRPIFCKETYEFQEATNQSCTCEAIAPVSHTCTRKRRLDIYTWNSPMYACMHTQKNAIYTLNSPQKRTLKHTHTHPETLSQKSPHEKNTHTLTLGNTHARIRNHNYI